VASMATTAASGRLSSTPTSGLASGPTTPVSGARGAEDVQTSPRKGHVGQRTALASSGWSSRPRTTMVGIITHGSSAAAGDLEQRLQVPGRAGAGYGWKGHGPCRPASPSPFETALLNGPRGWQLPAVKELDNLQSSLEQDAARFSQKYGMLPNSTAHQQYAAHFSQYGTDLSSSARFTVKLPTSPQHHKHCRPASRQAAREVPTAGGCVMKEALAGSVAGDEAGTASASTAPVLRQRVAYDIKRLEEWFKFIDTNDSGEVNSRKMIVGLLKNQELLDLFFLLKDGGHRSKDLWALSTQQRPKVGQLSRKDMSWVRDILSKLDQDGNASMEWPEFVDFFRKAGMLLEYQSRPDLNTSGLGGCLGNCITSSDQRRDVENREKMPISHHPAFARRGAHLQSPVEVERSISRKAFDLAGCEQGQVG